MEPAILPAPQDHARSVEEPDSPRASPKLSPSKTLSCEYLLLRFEIPCPLDGSENSTENRENLTGPAPTKRNRKR